MTSEHMNAAQIVIFMTGVAVWVCILFAGAAFLLFCILPAIFRWLCLLGYDAFMGREEKRVLKEYARKSADNRIAAIERSRKTVV